jgi:hypothetical protein
MSNIVLLRGLCCAGCCLVHGVLGRPGIYRKSCQGVDLLSGLLGPRASKDTVGVGRCCWAAAHGLGCARGCWSERRSGTATGPRAGKKERQFFPFFFLFFWFLYQTKMISKRIFKYLFHSMKT